MSNLNVPSGFRALPLSIAQLSLAAVLKCGQSFRWSVFPLSDDSSVREHEYRLCLRDRVVCLRQSPDALFYRSVFPEPTTSQDLHSLREGETLAFIRDYFQLDVDLVKLYDQWSCSDPVFKTFGTRFSGIRILRQEPWENLISFICSSNNNISRITNMVQSLCQRYSPPLLSLADPPSSALSDPQVRTYHPFPPPSVLAAPDVSSTLRSLGFGYRAAFIQKTAKMLVDAHGPSIDPSDHVEPAEKWLKTLRGLKIADAREELLKFMGVGRKVADCVLLMSLDKQEVIPVDTHVHQIAIKYYGLPGSTKTRMTMSPKIYESVNTRLVSVWGEYAGWAHSVLFTADLKSFSTYGLSTVTAPLETPTRKGRQRTTPIPKRRSSEPYPRTEEKSTLQASSMEGPSLVDRVKARRRTTSKQLS